MRLNFGVVVAVLLNFVFFFFKQKTAYEMRISDWSSDVCSSDLAGGAGFRAPSLRAAHELSLRLLLRAGLCAADRAALGALCICHVHGQFADWPRHAGSDAGRCRIQRVRETDDQDPDSAVG